MSSPEPKYSTDTEIGTGEGSHETSRILFVAKNVTGGSIQSLLLIIENLDRRRYDPSVLFLRSPSRKICGRLESAGVEYLIVAGQKHRQVPPVDSKGKPPESRSRLLRFMLARSEPMYYLTRAIYLFIINDIPIIWRAYRLLKGHTFDLVHVNSDPRAGRAGVVLARVLGARCICHCRMWSRWTALERVLFRFVDWNIYISKAIEEYHVQQGAVEEKGRVIYNAVDVSDYIDVPDYSVREEFGWNEKHFIVGIVGRIDWWKGHDYLLLALRDVVERYQHVRCLIVGESDARNKNYAVSLLELRKDLGLEDYVVFTDHREDVLSLLHDMDTLALCSTEPEPFGRVIIEGMAAGRAVIGTDSGGVPEIIDHGRTGLLVPPKDASALAAAICRLIENPELTAELGTTARREVQELFSLKEQLKQLHELYVKLVNSRSLSRRSL